MDTGWFFIGSLVVWRVTHLLSKEDGPFEIMFWIRKKAGAGFFGNLLDCFYCLSIWIAIPFAIWIGNGYKQVILLWLGFSGLACVIEKFSNRREIPGHPPHYSED
jgi:Protein of unknown function (DUF1360)